MKRVLLAVLTIVSIASLSGCVGSLGNSIYNKIVTPETDICDQTLGKKVTDAETVLNMGKPDRLKRKSDGTQTRIYNKGAMKATVQVDINGVVTDAECNKEKSE